MLLKDKFGRIISYLRLAVTDRCNFRCSYCMPEEGIDFVARNELLSYEEMERLVRIFVSQGVTKLRITGGEPFVRKDLSYLLESVSKFQDLNSIHITSNGTLIDQHIGQLSSWKVKSVNISLDSLKNERFFSITKRDELGRVLNCIVELIKQKIQVKINMVIQSGINTDEILEFVKWTKETPVEVRFIEEMPFNGNQGFDQKDYWNYQKIFENIHHRYPNIHQHVKDKNSSSFEYLIPGHKGSIGIIPAYSRSLCGTCNRVRVTPEGWLKVCLYDEGIFNLRDFLRNGATDLDVINIIQQAVSMKLETGFQAESLRNKSSSIRESMAQIGG